MKLSGNPLITLSYAFGQMLNFKSHYSIFLKFPLLSLSLQLFHWSKKCAPARRRMPHSPSLCQRPPPKRFADAVVFIPLLWAYVCKLVPFICLSNLKEPIMEQMLKMELLDRRFPPANETDLLYRPLNLLGCRNPHICPTSYLLWRWRQMQSGDESYTDTAIQYPRKVMNSK